MAFSRGKLFEGRTTTGALSLGGQYVYKGQSPAPGIGGFNPTSVFAGGQQGIYIAPWETATIFGSDGITPISAVNQPVGKVADLSGNGNHAIQETSSKQPIYKVDGNGKPYLEFDGIDDFLSFSLLSLLRNVSGATIIAAVKYRTTSASSKTLFQATTPAGSGRVLVGASLTTASRLTVGGRRLDSDNLVHVATAANYSAAAYIQTGIIDYANRICRQRINSILDGENLAFQTTGSTSDINSNYIGVGASISSTNPANIDLYGLFVAPRALSDAEILRAENFFKAKAGI